MRLPVLERHRIHFLLKEPNMPPEAEKCNELIATIRSIARKDADALQQKLNGTLERLRAAMADVFPWTRGEWYAHYRRELATLAEECERWPNDGTLMKRGNSGPRDKMA